MQTFTIAPEEGKTYTSKKGYPCKADKDIATVTCQVGQSMCLCVSGII